MILAHRFELGDLVIDPARLLIVRADSEHSVRNLDMDVLVVLAMNAPEVVLTTSLIEEVWPRGHVTRGVVANGIRRLRLLLGDNHGVAIETVRGRGYRLNVVPRQIEIEAKSAAIDAASWSDGSPYRGLQPFLAEHQPVFFGRDREIRQLLLLMQTQTANGRGFLLLLGPSGAGKTSLLEAGLLPALVASQIPELVGYWHIGRLVYDSQRAPWTMLADALTTAIPAAAGVGGGDLGAALATDFEATIETVEELVVAPGSTAEPHRVLLVLDQFEALLAQPSVELDLLFDALLLMSRSGVFWLVAALRSDYYLEFSQHAVLLSLKGSDGQFDVQTPGLAQIGSIVREPAALAGLQFGADPESGARLDDLLQSEARDGVEALPLLEFTLAALYESRDDQDVLGFSQYAQLGGLGGALATRAEQVFLGLDATAQAELPAVLGAMVAASAEDQRIRRRYVSLAEITSSLPRERLLDAFIAARLFVTDLIDGEPRVSVAHEALLRRWARAEQSLVANLELLNVRRRLGESSALWESNGRSEAFLLSQGLLAESERLRESGLAESGRSEMDLLAASTRRWQRSDRLRRMAIGALAALAVVAVVAAGLAVRREAEVVQHAQRAEQTADFLLRVFESANPGPRSTYKTGAKELLDQAERELNRELHSQPEVRADLTRTIGVAYMGFAAYDQADRLLRSALAQRLGLGAPAGAIAQSTNDLGRLAYYRGDYDTAKEHYLDAQSLLAEQQLDDSLEYAQTLNNLGETAAAQGQYPEALDAHQQALAIRTHLLGPDAIATATSLQNLAGVNRRSGELSSAESMYRDALARLLAQLGPDHPEVAVARSNLGLLLSDTNRLTAAEELLQLALATRRSVFGTVHPHTANSLHNLAAVLFKQRAVGAEAALRESLAVHIELFGADHDSVAYSRNNLATLLLETDQCGDARPLFAGAFAALLELLGEAHPNTALIRANLARAELQCGELPSALQHAQAALETLSVALPAGHWRIGSVRGIYAETLARSGDFEAAERAYRQSIDELEQALGADNEATLTVRGRFEQLLETLGQQTPTP